MPAPRPPKPLRKGGKPTAHEYNRAMKQVAASARLTAERPLTIAQGASGFHLALDTSAMPFLARLTAVYTPASGPQAGLHLYSFVEQTFSTATGIPEDASPGRQTVAPSGVPIANYALENNNRIVTAVTAIPGGFNVPTSYVEMRLKGVVNGVSVYEFDSRETEFFVAGLSGVGVDRNEPEIIVTSAGNVTAWPCGWSLGPIQGGNDTWPAWTFFLDGGFPDFTGGVCYRAWLWASTTTPPPNAEAGTYNVFAIDHHAPVIRQTVNGQGASQTIVLAEPNLVLDATDILFGPPYVPAGNFLAPDTKPASTSFTNLSVNAGGVYAGASGTDGIGNVFISGLCANVGGPAGIPAVIDGGSDW